MRRALVIAADVAAAASRPARQGSVTVRPAHRATDSCGSSIVSVQDGSPGYVAPSNGVIVSWSYLAGSQTPAVKLRAYQPTANAMNWIARSESTLKQPGTGAGQVVANKLNTFSE